MLFHSRFLVTAASASLFFCNVSVASDLLIDATVAGPEFDPEYEIEDRTVGGGYVQRIIMEAVSPETIDVSCMENFGSTQCQGEINLDVSAFTSLSFTFRAPDGMEFQLNGGEDNRVEFEFRASVPCGGPIPPGPRFYQDVDGTMFTPTITGSNIGDLEYNADESFLELGRCDGCSECEIFSQVRLIGVGGETAAPFVDARIQEVSWTVTYDPALTIQGSQTYRVGSDVRIRASNDSIIWLMPVPSDPPSMSPSEAPSKSKPPSSIPSRTPSTSSSPSLVPSVAPSGTPSGVPSGTPSSAPSDSPSEAPSKTPSSVPSDAPSTSVGPSTTSSVEPSMEPTTISPTANNDAQSAAHHSQSFDDTVAYGVVTMMILVLFL